MEYEWIKEFERECACEVRRQMDAAWLGCDLALTPGQFFANRTPD